MNKILQWNLKLMLERGRGHLSDLESESMGGNAGNYQGHSCMAANFYYEFNTGWIVYFGNFQNVPLFIRQNPLYAEGTFRIAKIFDLSKKAYPLRDEIVQIYYLDKTPLPHVQEILLQTMQEFNTIKKAEEQQALQKRQTINVQESKKSFLRRLLGR